MLLIGITLAAPDPALVRESLRERIETAGFPPRTAIGSERIHASIALPQFYLNRGFNPAWTDSSGRRPLVPVLMSALRSVRLDGLRPADYHLSRIEASLASQPHRGNDDEVAVQVRRLVDLELLLTDAFLVLGAHLVSGKVNPEVIDPEWHAVRREADLVSVLADALARRDPAGALTALLPSESGYWRLRETLARYRTIANQGGWPIVPDSTLAAGDSGSAVPALRRRLEWTGDLRRVPGDSSRFDSALSAGLSRFQARHGLASSGLLDSATIAALNVTAAERVRQLELNLERWRWLPQTLGDRHAGETPRPAGRYQYRGCRGAGYRRR